MFTAEPTGELTQVDFWNLYKDTFTPYQTSYHLLVASDVIKNVSVVFPQAQAMVLPGPPQRFVVRGVDRRKDLCPLEQFRCRWHYSQCPAGTLGSTSELYEHILQEHINPHEGTELPCAWATCRTCSLRREILRSRNSSLCRQKASPIPYRTLRLARLPHCASRLLTTSSLSSTHPPLH